MTTPSPFRWYSASQLETYSRCNLKWWWERVGGFKSPPSASMLRGTEIHAEVERWVESGVMPNDPRARSAVDKLVERWGTIDRDAWESERKFEMVIANDIGFVGYIDLGARSTDVPLIVDMKTTSDVGKYGKVEHELPENIQMNCYAKEALDRFQAPAVDVAHLQVQTKGRIMARVVETRLQRDHVESKWKGYLRVIDQMEVDRTKTKPDQVQANPFACDDYGGCPHRARCGALIFDDLLEDRGSEEEDTLFNPPDSTRRVGDQPPATPLTIDKEDMPKALEKETRLMSPLEKMAAMAAGKPAQVEEAPKDKLAAFKAMVQQKVVGGDADIVPEPATRAKIDATTPEAAPEKPARKPRTKKEAPIADPAQEIITTTLQAPPLSETENTAADHVPPPPATAGVVGEISFLFLDCFPVHGGGMAPTKLGVWLEPILERIKMATGADWQFHEFRKASAVLNQFAKQAPLPKALVVDSGSPESGVLWEYLISKTKNGVIIQGLRR